MGERPIIMSAPMVRVLLAGSKTQTRRVLRLQPIPFDIDDSGTLCDVGCLHVEGETVPRVTLGRVVTTQKVPYAVGDRLWVRETWAHDAPDLETARAAFEDALGGAGYGPYYRATEPAPDTLFWRSPIHMPRWASRLTLMVTDVRVQRLQDISEEDARAEGITETVGGWWTGAEGQAGTTPRAAYTVLWNSLHGPDAWAANPWVAAISFKTIIKNIDAMGECK